MVRGPRGELWRIALAILAFGGEARAQLHFGPATPADPPLPPGSAEDPRDDPARVTPTAREKYPAPADTTGAPLAPDRKRDAEDYGGPRRSTNVGDLALVVPRVALLPLYLVTEYVVRRPLGAAITFAERHRLPQLALYYFSFGTYGTDHAFGFFPTADFEWGIRANAGLLFFWDHRSNALRASATLGGPDWQRLALVDRFPLDARSTMTARTAYERRADLRFWGLGPSSPSEGHRFGLRRVSAGLAFFTSLWRSSAIETSAGLRSAMFDVDAPGEPTVRGGLETGAITRPPGFDGYVIADQRIAAAIDTRLPRLEPPRPRATDFLAPPGTGLRIEGHAEHAVELAQRRGGPRDRGQWLKYGGGIGAYWDVTGLQRTLGIALSTELVERFRDASVPFLELPTLGGTEPMRAYRFYRLLGESYVAAKASYSWPVWTDFDGVVEAAFGNVFGPHYDGFSTGLLRGSFSTGLQTTSSRYLSFQVLFGVGTRTFDDGFGVEAVRFVAGTSSTF